MNCVLCGESPRKARGLCGACYQRERYHGRLDEHERASILRGELLDELSHLVNRHEPLAPQFKVIAPRLGMTYKAVERAWNRARKDGVA